MSPLAELTARLGRHQSSRSSTIPSSIRYPLWTGSRNSRCSTG